jgi:hypothetical protein
MKIDDLSAGPKAGILQDATADRIDQSLQEWGLAILRGALPTGSISGLLLNAIDYSQKVAAVARAGGTDFGLDPSYRFNPVSFACELTALDPQTKGDDDFSRTSLWFALRKSIIRDAIVKSIGAQVNWTTARARAIIPDLKAGSGKLGLHYEETAFPYHDVHNIWTPLVRSGIKTNVDAPGLEFFLGHLGGSPDPRLKAAAFVQKLGASAFEDEPACADDCFVYRPELESGDIALFRGFVPHATYVPPAATEIRVACDIRIFPRSEANTSVSIFPQSPLELS